ncbi:MAG: hypothetical protein WDN27_02400 [Candidatus Saccharibacteria bacterium]
MNNNDFFAQLKPYGPESYETISLAQLVAFCVDLLRKNEISTTFETLTVTAFKLFPVSFALVGFDQYPDAARVGRALLQARPKYQNLIVGDVHKGYRLTQKGEYSIKKATALIKGEHQASDKKKIARDRTFVGKVAVTKIEQSDLYKTWLADKETQTGLYDIWLFLEVAPYTEKRVVKEIVNDYKAAAEAADRKDISDFLNWLKTKYPEVIG